MAPHASSGTGDFGPRRGAHSHRIHTPITPVISPPMCPPIEMPGTANVNTRLIRISGPMPVWNGLMPRDRMATNVAPIRPNTAPEAPIVTASLSRISVRNEPPSSDIT